MRKLYILKAIIDFLWIFSTITILILVAVLVGVWFVDMSTLISFTTSSQIVDNSFYSKITVCIISVSYLMLIIALFYFRKILEQFIRVRIFDESVIKYLHFSGNLLLISGIISTTTIFLYQIIKSPKVTVSIGFNQNIIVICMGLFLLVLSQIFKIAKANKEENDLTI